MKINDILSKVATIATILGIILYVALCCVTVIFLFHEGSEGMPDVYNAMGLIGLALLVFIPKKLNAAQ